MPGRPVISRDGITRATRKALDACNSHADKLRNWVLNNECLKLSTKQLGTCMSVHRSAMKRCVSALAMTVHVHKLVYVR